MLKVNFFFVNENFKIKLNLKKEKNFNNLKKTI